MTAPLMTLAQAQALLPGSVLVGDAEVVVKRVHSDTRTLRPGDLFVALKGERFDAHDFLPQARAAGAVAALQQLSAAWRQRFSLPLIAVTGSNGKTTVTQMIASILRAAHGDSAFATQGNLNNHIGLPLTLLRLRAEHRAGVVELGMNHPGEIAALAAMAAPTVALVNNAQREHQEFMSSVEAVAHENGAAIAALPAGGVAVFPADDPHTPVWRGLAGARKTQTFALEGRADVSAKAVWMQDQWAVELHSPAGSCELVLQVAGSHNVKNALAAAACALAAGCPLGAVQRGLEAFSPVKGRSQIQHLGPAGREATLIDDSYNANPDSVRAAIDVLAGLPGPRWLVLGDMGEVGSQGPAFHREVGAYAAERGVEHLWTAGAQSRLAAEAHGAARQFDSTSALVAALAEAPRFASVVVKGSRFMKMEAVVAALKAAGGSHAA